jgi:Caspase domain
MGRLAGKEDMIGRRVVVLALWALCLLNHSAQAADLPDDTPENSVVLLVGAGDYGLWGELKGPAFDICALYGLYRDLLRIPAANIIVLLSVPEGHDPPCKIPGVRSVTDETLRSSLAGLVVRQPLPRAVYLHFSGHGFEEGSRQRLVLSAGRGDETAEVIALDDLLAVLRSPASDSPKLAVFIDACRDTSLASDTHMRSERLGRQATETARRALNGRVGAVYFASSSGEFSHTRRSIQGARNNQLMGYFTWATIRGMVGGARQNNGEINFGSLASYIEQEVAASRRYELGGVVVEPQTPQHVMLSERSSNALLGAPHTAFLNQSFQFYAEASVEAMNEAGASLAGPFSYDIMTPQSQRPATELNLIGATVVQPPGPFRLLLPRGMDVPSDVHHWTFVVRAVFFYGPNRREFIVCNASPRVPEGQQPKFVAPEILTTIDRQELVLDIRGAWVRIGHWIRDVENIYNPAVQAEHTRTMGTGC